MLNLKIRLLAAAALLAAVLVPSAALAAPTQYIRCTVGYVGGSQYVVVGTDEKGELRERDDKAISIDTFVSPDAIDPIYFSGRTYYLVPNGPAAQKPYAVMFDAMRAHHRLAIARLVLSGRGHIAVVRPFGRLLGMTLLAFEDQVKAPGPFEAEVGSPAVSAHEKRAAFSVPARASRVRSCSSVTSVSIAAAIARASSGSNVSAAASATSASAPRSEHATGTPRDIASSTGRPKPSYREGKTKPVAAR